MCLVYKVERSSAWARQRGFACAANVEELIFITVDFPSWQMQQVEHSVGQPAWFSNALINLERLHSFVATQMHPKDK